ncbi:uncharacterized protein LOC123258846 [Cotesia glomerata]|uniref:Uncharacterized protein n=1 Tax=Cotesia glomerata TaxID=32391 RepID=A0AAV7I353_COTGL|nr:uncharacterized protein LOC123258846 [Cotesia glomerata]KAH0540455.1 hypothetical protein KQX54_017511 [Cotesia glomerata]
MPCCLINIWKSIFPSKLPSISIIKILQLIVVCCIFGIDVHTKNYSQPDDSSGLLNEVVDKIPNLNIKINTESMSTEYLSTGTVVAYLIIIFVSLVSGLFASPISLIPNTAFCVIGAFLFVISGSFIIHEFLHISFESIKEVDFEKSLQSVRSYSIARGSLCIVEAALLLLDPICSFIPFL